MNKIFSIAIAALIFTSCQSSTENGTADSVSGDSATTSSQTADPSSPNATTGSPTSTSATQGATGDATLNPEHGKPGHRCDIAVGAPLNSPPGKAMPSPLQDAAPGMMMPTPAPAPAQAGGGGNGQRINPAHGAPGHDCSVPVGQPLKG